MCASRREKGQPRKEKPSTLKDLQDDVVLSGLDKKICGDWPGGCFRAMTRNVFTLNTSRERESHQEERIAGQRDQLARSES